MKRVVLDASAVMTFFKNRPGAEKVEDLMRAAIEGKEQLLMSVVNWGEVYHSVWRANGFQAADQVAAEIARLPIKLVDVDIELTKSAASFRAKHKLPYVDCFVAALAQVHHGEIITSGRDFALIQDELTVKII